MNTITETSGKARTVQLGVAVVSAVLLLIVAVSVVPPLFKKTTVDKGALAFGKLPARGVLAAASSAVPALGMPAGGEAFFWPPFEYSWTGGPWPDLTEKMAVYRRVAAKISPAEAKTLATKFGLTGEPEPDEPIQLLNKDGTSAPGGQTEPSAPGGKEAEPSMPEPVPFRSFRFYDQASGKRFEILEAEGRFSYMVEGAWQAAENHPDARPAEGEAREIAIGFLRDKGLLPNDYTGPFIADTGVVASGSVSPDGAEPMIEEQTKVIQPPYVEVQFGKKLGAYNIVEPSGEPSRYIASVTVGPGGSIMAASGEIPVVFEESAYPLMGVATAFAEVKKGTFGDVRALGGPVPMMSAPADTPVQSSAGNGGQGAAGNPAVPPVKPEPVKVKLSQVKLAYLLVLDSDGVGYYEPAYVFSGKIGPSGGGSDYSVAVPAVTRDHIKAESR